uniref:hypothetical protein n=1 Tax=Roseivirga sp. TaxID=1964215 RepID=UPI004047836E
MQLNNSEFDIDKFSKRLESIVYLIFVLPLLFFGYAFLERESAGGLRSVFFEDPDILFHGVMAAGIGYILMRTSFTWKQDLLKSLESIPELDLKIQRLRWPIIYRNILWSFGAGIGAYGLYEKGDMVYAIVFSLFLILITSNRPSPKYFIKFFKLKGEERKWIEGRNQRSVSDRP